MGKLQGRVSRELTLYVRQMAWLHATPKPPDGSQRAAMKGQTLISRLDQYKRDGITPQMPPVTMPHIIDRLVEIGMTDANGMTVGWQTLRAWSEMTCVRLSPWEARLLRQLSSAYVSEGRAAESENCPPPWRGEMTDRERDVEDARLRSVLG